MPTAKEATEKWLEALKTQGKLSDENLESIKSALTPEAQEFLGGSVLRQEDYSRLAAQAKAKEREVAEFQTALTEWKGSAEAEYLAMQRAKASADAEVARLQTLAKAYEIPETEYGKVPIVPEQIQQIQNTQQVDTSEFIKTKDAQEAMINALKVQNKLISLSAKHQTYFGQPLDDEELVDRAINNQRTIEQEWEDTYKVSDKRAEIAQAASDAHDQKIREEERARVLSELKLPETRPGAPSSPIHNMFKSTIDTVNDQQSGLQAALEAYGQGTYRKPGA